MSKREDWAKKLEKLIKEADLDGVIIRPELVGGVSAISAQIAIREVPEEVVDEPEESKE